MRQVKSENRNRKEAVNILRELVNMKSKKESNENMMKNRNLCGLG